MNLPGPENPGESEKNSGSCEGPVNGATVPSHAVAGPFLDSPDCSFGSPLQAAGAAQRDERELAPSDLEEFDTVAHPPGIEETDARWEDCQSACSAQQPVQLETRGVTSQKTKTFQRELWNRQTIHKNTVSAKLREIGRTDLADGLELCHSETTWCVCKGCSAAKPFLNRCERFYCPECQPTLSRDRERSIGWWVREMSQPKHVVLTLKNFPRLNRRIINWAKKCFGRLRRRKFAANWQGGFYNWEITKEVAGSVKNGHIMSGGWHLHVHALIEAKWIDINLLSEEWAKVTRGWGRIVDVNDARRVDYLKEVTKYAVKGNQLAAWSGDDIAMFIDSFKGIRTFGVFGTLYGKRTEFREWLQQLQQHKLKCKCGCEEFWYQTDWDYHTADGMLVHDSPPRGPSLPSTSQLILTIV